MVHNGSNKTFCLFSSFMDISMCLSASDFKCMVTGGCGAMMSADSMLRMDLIEAGHV